MDRIKFWDRQHVSISDMIRFQQDFVDYLNHHIEELHNGDTKFTTTGTSTGTGSCFVHQDVLPSLTVGVSAGVSYFNGNRVPIDTNQTFTLSNAPSGINSLYITKIDLVGVKWVEVESAPFTVDFLDLNNNIYQAIVNTRILDSFEFVQVQGTVNSTGYFDPSITPSPYLPDDNPAKPPIPTDVVPLAWVYFRPNTTAIYDDNTNGLGTGYLQDARVLYVV